MRNLSKRLSSTTIIIVLRVIGLTFMPLETIQTISFYQVYLFNKFGVIIEEIRFFVCSHLQ